ncbi:sucrose phosphorylase [Hyunsoonleella pacifica]|uniref:Sucrose phosphorylase n=1 Tax=Hyunsoonleella pacifica TaxID=1080224 RepID=A0A4V2JB23_9FLAO|nr:sucrose phosphorylase [Hyunsoonleella pacifica]TBN16473.1 sucrose phosphorylase [Hyunsoonleella pacifica]GGD19106.1 sucrose phosphorylase [Hyunsoonleella pacifica]
MLKDSNIANGVMLNAYPDSIGRTLSDTINMLKRSEFKDVFSLFYILPTFFNSDLDRGFSIIDYNRNEELVSKSDLEDLEQLNIQLKLDIVLNHLSVASPQFKDLLKNGNQSKYKDFFINWNTFWEGNGAMGEDGIVIPKKEFLDKLFMRKSGLPVLKVPFPDGSEEPYWNTFYQKTNADNSVLGQMDVNATSQLVWDFYKDTLQKVSSYGCKILRLDAFAYLHKAVGASNFFNKPGTWDYLERIKQIADKNNLTLLPEIHAEYGTYLHDEVAKKGYQIYDFFLPGLMIHTIEKKDSNALLNWANEIIDKGYKTVNMLGCHDGIPVLDLKGKEVDSVYYKGLLLDEDIEDIMDIIIERGGRVKNLYGPNGKKISYYQVNATFFSALGESEQKLLLARAIQMFMPGIPQVWYLDIFAGKNDYKAADNAGSGGHKEINRTTLSVEDIEEGLKKDVVLNQLKLLRLRNTSKAFSGSVEINTSSHKIIDIKWVNENEFAHLKVNLNTYNFTIDYTELGESKFYAF